MLLLDYTTKGSTKGCKNWTVAICALRKMISSDIVCNRHIMLMIMDIARHCKCYAVQVEKNLAVRIKDTNYYQDTSREIISNYQKVWYDLIVSFIYFRIKLKNRNHVSFIRRSFYSNVSQLPMVSFYVGCTKLKLRKQTSLTTKRGRSDSGGQVAGVCRSHYYVISVHAIFVIKLI